MESRVGSTVAYFKVADIVNLKARIRNFTSKDLEGEALNARIIS